MAAMSAERAESSQLGPTPSAGLMKAIVQDSYGEPEAVLGLQDVAKPVVNDSEVLVRVHAASVHVGDWMLVTGVPYIARPAYGMPKPKSRVPGTDIAGTVEAVGKDVTELRPDDEVIGWCAGAFAEYACAAQDHFVLKPANLTFEQAAAIGVSASTALQILRDQGKVKPGQKVLINGASGGIGTFAVQIAKAFGADVTGVCSTRNVDMVRRIGADHVIDYTRENFTAGVTRYDVILDIVSSQSWPACRRVLTPGGKYIPVGGPPGRGIRLMLLEPFTRGKLVTFVARVNAGDLNAIREMIEAGAVTPVIDRTYKLEETADAVRYVAAGHTRGKVVIAIGG